MIENLGFEAVPEEQTEEEASEKLEALSAKKADAAKKSKAKPKTEEEEAAELENLILKTSQELAAALTKDNSEKIMATEREIELLKTRWLMKNHIKMDSDQYDCINRKLSFYDIDIGSKDLLLRLDLDVVLSKFDSSLIKKEDPASAMKSMDGKTSLGGGSKANAKISDIGSVVSISPLGDQEDYWKGRQILDHSWCKRTVAELRACMDRMANRVFVIGNLGERHGKIMG